MKKLRICVTMAVKNEDRKMNKNVQRPQNSKTKNRAEKLKNLIQSQSNFSASWNVSLAGQAQW